MQNNPHTAIVKAVESGPINWARYYDNNGKVIADFDLRTNPASALAESDFEQCGQCNSGLTPPIDRVSVRRHCAQCGQFKFDYSGLADEGPNVTAGEDIVIPYILLRQNLRLTDGASFTRHGIDWLARISFNLGNPLDPSKSELIEMLRGWVEQADFVLANLDLTLGLDLNSKEGFTRVVQLAKDNPYSIVFSAITVHTKAKYLIDLLNESSVEPIELAALATTTANAHAVLNFKLAFEEAAFKGSYVDRLRHFISTWAKQSHNNSEAFWQELLLTNPVALTQLFATPVVIHGEQYFVGGTRAGGGHSKIADYLLRNQLTGSAAIVEIKTPTTPCFLSVNIERMYLFHHEN